MVEIMKNFAIEHNGRTWWISRSSAIAINVYGVVSGKFCVLANKRGPGLPSNIGKWNCVSGYVDYDEDLKDACVREVFEETGVKIKKSAIKFIEFEDSPKRANQTILFRYMIFCEDAQDQVLTTENSEPDEVDEIKWIPIEEIDNYEWVSELHKSKILLYASEIQEEYEYLNVL